MEKTILVVTHGDKYSGANPQMTPEGLEQVKRLRGLIPRNPPAVVCGTGQRHWDVAGMLGFEPTRITSIVGGPDSLEIIDGIKHIILADGRLVDPALYTSLTDEADAAKVVIASLPDQSVVCAGRPSMIMLGEPNAKSAAVYDVHVMNNEIVDITEVVATGVAEDGTV